MDKQYNITDDGTYFDARTNERVVKALQQARRAQCTIRLFQGDTETGVAWNEEYDVVGRVSRSMGPHKVPILINNRRSMGGGAILDHCVIGIIMRDRSNAMQWLYRHPNIDLGVWDVKGNDDTPLLKAEVFCNGQVHARFDTTVKAQRYADFMTGKRLRK